MLLVDLANQAQETLKRRRRRNPPTPHTKARSNPPTQQTGARSKAAGKSASVKRGEGAAQSSSSNNSRGSGSNSRDGAGTAAGDDDDNDGNDDNGGTGTGTDDIFDTHHLFETLPRDVDGWVVIPSTEPFQQALALLTAARHWLALALKLDDQVGRTRSHPLNTTI